MLIIHPSGWSRGRGPKTATGENAPRIFRDWQFGRAGRSQRSSFPFRLPTRKRDAQGEHILGQWDGTDCRHEEVTALS
jgi:hypothetical protein